MEEAIECAFFRGLTTYGRAVAKTLELSRSGFRGVDTVKRILKARYPDQSPPESIFETRFYRALRSSTLPPSDFQFCVHDAQGFVARLDVAYPARMVGVEAHSMKWHYKGRNVLRDSERHNRLTALGWRILYETWHSLEREPEKVVARLAAVLGVTLPGIET